MEDDSKLYHHTGQFYTKSSQLQDFIDNDAVWAWEPNFHVCQNFKYGLFRDEFITALDKRFGGFLALYKIPARCVYKWHRDGRHKWAINMVLDTFNSHTLFEKETFNTLLYVEELTYKPLEWVIFNTQELHTVINLDSRDRVLATYRIGVSNPNPCSYQEVCNWYKNEYAGVRHAD